MAQGPTVDELKAFFLEAALATYAGGGSEGTVIELPRGKAYTYPRDGLLYIDTYFTNGEYSGGQTIIQADGETVWMMQYQGWCKNNNPEVLDFLKRALVCAYQDGDFNMGRGFPHYQEESQRWEGGEIVNRSLVYINYPVGDTPNNFTNFEGREVIYMSPDRDTELFWHRFSGLLLRNE